MEIGLHIANLTYSGGATQLAPDLAKLAKAAEAGGFTRITVMDHVWQIQGLGPIDHDMLEAYTLLGFLAAHTEKVLLHTMVTGVVYREPGMLAKAVTTLDVLSGGRAGLGIGAAWNEVETTGLGIPFPPLGERFERLEETIQICLQMWSDDLGPYKGKHYTLGSTLNVPQSLSRPRPYLLIGGTGERKTLRMVAQYADGCNIFTTDETQHKMDVLKNHCDDLGRDFDSIEKTTNMRISPDSTRDSLLADFEKARGLGFTVAYATPNQPDPLRAVDLLASIQSEVAAL